MLEEYIEVKGALRTKKFKEVLSNNISSVEGTKQNALNEATVTISTNKVFYVDPISRADLTDAIAIALETGATETTWKLAEEFDGSKWALVTLAELQEARKLGLQYKGSLLN